MSRTAGVTNASGGPLPLPSGKPGKPGQLTEVYLTVGVRTSAGPGPGPKRLPAAEAGALVAAKHAVYGSEPPHGYDGVL